MDDIVISTEGLVKRFKDVVALDGVTLQVRRGEVFGLLGPNGAGKTTLIRILIGIFTPTEGKAEVLGYDSTENPEEIRKRVALLPQEAETYENLTAWENIAYYAGMYGLEKNEIESRTQKIVDLIGLKERAGDVTREFSGGMKRKVLVGRALVLYPEILFLDEPTTGIDILGARIVRHLLKQLSETEKITTVLTTHDLTEIKQLCNRVGILVEGKLVAIGRPDELEDKFKAADLEDVFVGLVTGERV
ncbi:MAG: ABC transporter ATP-binding protein [Candidatus Hodarchaeota archaeon]